ncbi:MAG: hypothetical protein ACM3JC_15545 [Rudaea sp.]
MPATMRPVGECYASAHELFDIGLASVEPHVTGLRAPVSHAAMRGEPEAARRMHARPAGPRAADDQAILVLLGLFLHAGEVGIALALAGLFELFDLAHPLLAAILAASGCALAWYAWRGARATLARAGHAPARAH